MANLLAHCAELPRTPVAAGDVLITQGQPHGAVYVLVEGVLGVERGGTRLATITTPGSVVGEMSILMQSPATATVRADMDSIVVAIADGEQFLVSRGDVTLTVARTLATRLDVLSGYLADVKRQYAGRDDHLGMVDEVLSTLLNDQLPQVQSGSARMPETEY